MAQVSSEHLLLNFKFYSQLSKTWVNNKGLVELIDLALITMCFLVSYEEILPLGSEFREVSVKSIIKQKIKFF